MNIQTWRSYPQTYLSTSKTMKSFQTIRSWPTSTAFPAPSFVFVPLAIQNANIQDVSFTAPPSLLLGQTAQSWLLFIPYSSPPPAPPKALCADWFCAFWHWFGVLVMGLWWKYGLIQVSDVKGVVDTWKCGLVVGSFFL